MSKTAQETDRIVGIVLRAFPARKAGKYTVYDFVLRTPTGDLKVSRFGTSVQDYVGENVSFDATYNDQYDRYTVQGEVTGIDAPTVAEPVPHADVVETPKTRGRKASPKTATEAVALSHAEGSRESYRDAAVEAVALNLTSAKQVAEQLGLKVVSVQDLIAVADMVGRTQTAIQISSQKRN